MKSEASVLILDAPVDTDAVAPPFGKRWGDQLIRLTRDHLAALPSGKCLALDVQGKYAVYLKQERSNV